ncbi:hypothetical protein [Methyloversatilis sp. MC4-4]|uniref:hypothetical protein n=1 Tax=Methyloversatilis sp. MC4-4 TaxID=3132824 RepID=UPI003CE9142E
MSLVITLARTAPASWLRVQTVRAGHVPARLPTPDAYAMVEQAGEPLLKIEVYRAQDEGTAFEAAVLWKEFAAVGFGERLYLVSLSSHQVVEFPLDSYFGCLYANGDQLLVASAQRVMAIDVTGEILWQSEELGVDGVVFHEVNQNEIRGAGEWDPPGGWKEFRLSASTGHVLQPDA